MNIEKTPRRLSVSSWSLHRALGAPDFYGVGQAIPVNSPNGGAFRGLDSGAENFARRAVRRKTSLQVRAFFGLK